MSTRWICLSVLLSFSVPSLAGEKKGYTFQSPPEHVSLIELYTSEGCSSCPPADRFLSQLKHDKRLWKEFVPVAFHVDYWDYIGWKDRFADPKYTQRQNRYSTEWGNSTIYTPGFVVNGQEWRRWRGRPLPLPKNKEKVGVLSLNKKDSEVSFQFTPIKETKKKWKAHVAMLGMNVSNDVKAGENRGRTLKHDFVVVSHQTKLLEKKIEGGYLTTFATTFIPSKIQDALNKSSQIALVGWVSQENSLRPIQSTGGFLP